MLTETLHTQLAEVASQEAITHETPTVDGKQPAFGVAPRSLSELAAVVTELHQAESATILVGGGTMLDLGKPPTAAEVALCTGSLNLITEYQPADLIVTAQAGVTLANLQETLREHDQTLPLQVPCPDRATVGGAVAANTHGPLRYTFGTAKDLVMGMQFVQGDGTLVKSGGEVVKNVAGFGLHKLHVGALGTLGVIATTTFKVYPLPKADQTLIFTFEDADAAFAAAHAMRQHHPSSAVVGNTVAQQCLFGSVRGAHVLFVRFMGAQGAVARQVRDASAAGAEAGASATEVVGEAGGVSLWQQCVDLGSDSAAPKTYPVQGECCAYSGECGTSMRMSYGPQSPSRGRSGRLWPILFNGLIKCGIQLADGSESWILHCTDVDFGPASQFSAECPGSEPGTWRQSRAATGFAGSQDCF